MVKVGNFRMISFLCERERVHHGEVIQIFIALSDDVGTRIRHGKQRLGGVGFHFLVVKNCERMQGRSEFPMTELICNKTERKV